MPLPIQKYREILFQLLYSYDVGHPDDEDMIPLIMKEVSVTKKIVKDAQIKVRKIMKHLPEIDAIIAKTSVSYSFERIQNVERNILRLGVYELVYDEGMPPKAAIAEAMRLARKFGSPESAAFVNALLDNIYKSKQGETVDAAQIAQTAEELKKSEELANEASKKKSEEKEE